MIKIECGNEEDQTFIRENFIIFNQQKLPEHHDTPYGAVTYV